ncbi:ATP-dependent helicase BRM [Senna tora]|uniref:ATP-dependent helicase BRM n=1 Tax=Senna tora TaxID=362788 RepID=A0A835CJG4_9FABA|nr:ATP-dependent helicase BRM [Senna tora]
MKQSEPALLKSTIADSRSSKLVVPSILLYTSRRHCRYSSNMSRSFVMVLKSRTLCPVLSSFISILSRIHSFPQDFMRKSLDKSLKIKTKRTSGFDPVINGTLNS